MISQIYSILFIISCALLILLLSRYNNKISVFYFMLFGSVLIVNFGYMQMSSAKELYAAVYANQTVYLGACFVPYFLLKCVNDMCQIKLNKVLSVLLMILSIVVFFLTSTVGTNQLFYKSVTLEIYDNGLSHLSKVYGPLHPLYQVYLIIVLILGIITTLLSFVRKKDVSYKVSLSLVFIMMAVMILYFASKAFGLRFETIPIGYVFAEIGILITLGRVQFHSIDATKIKALEESGEYGFILLDDKAYYLGADDIAKAWFPELDELTFDTRLDNEFTDLLLDIGAWIRGEKEEEFADFAGANNEEIRVKHIVINDGQYKNLHGFNLQIKDTTKNSDVDEGDSTQLSTGV